MAKQNRRRSKTSARDVEVVPAMLWLGFGVLLGLGLAVYLLIAGVLPGKVSTASQSATSPAATRDDELAAARAIEQDDEPDLEFYEVLPELEVVVEESEIGPEADAAIDDDRDPDVFLLQAGSFRDSADAESRKAALAFLGMVAEITTVTVNGELWHRVQVGPYTSTRALDKARRQLRDNGIKALPTKAVR